jgi:phosphate acetyltransferase
VLLAAGKGKADTIKAMNLMQKLTDRAKADPRRIVFPEGEDERMVRSAVQVKAEGIAEPIVLGDTDTIKQVAEDTGLSLEGMAVINPREDDRLETFVEIYAANREIKPAIARKLMRRPLAFSGMLVREGYADGMVGGVSSVTAFVVQVASLTIGLADGISTPTSYFIMVVPDFLGQKDKIFIFVDSAVNIQPTAQQLAKSAVAVAADATCLLGIVPKVAFLSFSTKGSASHTDVKKVTEALAIAREIAPDLAMDGELQVDAAIVPSVALKKVKESEVAGEANVLIFPDLDAGNIAYKLVQYTANAMALGPVLVGFSRPVNDLSRGATVDDIVGITAITVIKAQTVK